MPKVVIVDKSKIFTLPLNGIILSEWEGMIVAQQHTIQSALDEITKLQIPIDLLIIDMWEENQTGGFEIVDAARKRNPQVKIIIISSRIDTKTLSRVIPDVYIEKPFNPILLIRTIAALFPKFKVRIKHKK